MPEIFQNRRRVRHRRGADVRPRSPMSSAIRNSLPLCQSMMRSVHRMPKPDGTEIVGGRDGGLVQGWCGKTFTSPRWTLDRPNLKNPGRSTWRGPFSHAREPLDLPSRTAIRPATVRLSSSSMSSRAACSGMLMGNDCSTRRFSRLSAAFEEACRSRSMASPRLMFPTSGPPALHV